MSVPKVSLREATSSGSVRRDQSRRLLTVCVTLILARFPAWEPFATVKTSPDEAGGTVEFNIPCPSPAADMGLWVSTADKELSVGFHTHHDHFADYETCLNPDRVSAGLDRAAAYLEDRLGVVSWYQAVRLAGTTVCQLPLVGPIPRMFAQFPVTRGTIRSWSGRHDSDELIV